MSELDQGGRIELDVPATRTIEFPLTPMLDVIFILLSVFLAISEARQSVHSLDLPEIQEDDAEPSVAPTDEEIVVVQIQTDGKILVDDGEVAVEEVGKAVLEIKAQHGADISVHLEAEESTEYGQILAVLRQLKAADLKHVDLAYRTKPKE